MCACYSSWCAECKDEGAVEKFVFNGSERCTLCWHAEPKRVKSSKLLGLAVTKLKTTKKALEEEFRAQAMDPAYRRARDHYYCTRCKNGECASAKCERVSRDCDVDDPDDDAQHRGLCCQAQASFGGVDEDDFCPGCQRWAKLRLALQLLGLRKFRLVVDLQWIPKDVLRFLILKL